MLPLLAALAICIPVILLFGAAHWIYKMVTNAIAIVGFLYPTIKSYQALQKTDFTDSHQMVVYWFVHTLVTALNSKMTPLFVAAISSFTPFGVLVPVIMSMIPVSLGPARMYEYAVSLLRFVKVKLPISSESKHEVERAIRDAQAGKPVTGNKRE